MKDRMIGAALGFLGAAAGAAAGYLAFGWLYHRGYYALALPPVLLGAGCAALSRTRSTARGVLCGLTGLAVAILARWNYFERGAGESLPYLVTHLGEQSQVTLIMFVVGSLSAYWFGKDGMLAS